MPCCNFFCGGASQKIKARYVCKHPVPIMYGVYRLSALFLMFMGLSPAAIRLLPAAFNMVFCFKNHWDRFLIPGAINNECVAFSKEIRGRF